MDTLASLLSLRRPLAFVDLETTGLDRASDRIVEIGILKIHSDGREEFRCERVNPGVPIPPDARAVHGISDADVAGKPPLAAHASSLNELLAGCDIAGFNVTTFDLPMLEAEFRRAGVGFSSAGRAVVDVMIVFHTKDSGNLATATRLYCRRNLPQAHSCEEDIRATVDVLRALLERHDDLPRDVAGLSGFGRVDSEGKFAWADGAAVITFGKHRGRKLQDVAATESDYLEWMLHEGDFSPEVDQIIIDALNGKFPMPPQGPSP